MIFFDNASTTKIDKDIIDKISEINDDFYYNPGSLYSKGRGSKDFLAECRTKILESINGDGDIYFTGSATEANNMAMFGVLKKNTRKILVSKGEHASVYNSALEMKERGHKVAFLSIGKDGCVDFDDFKNNMTEDVDFVSVMHVSNETGAINDIKTLVEYAKEINPNVIFHCDGVQALGKIAVDLDDLGVDMYTMSAHKIHGSKGVGALFVKSGVKLKPIIYGGGQESGLRSGTENIIGVYTLAQAVENAVNNLDKNYKYVYALKKRFVELLSKTDLNYVIHSTMKGSPYIVSISFPFCRAETILNMLSDRDVFVANGSACSSKRSGNRYLEAMGVPAVEIESNIRISFSKYNKLEEIDEFVKILNDIVCEYLSKTH